jgi:hypothetical protein
MLPRGSRARLYCHQPSQCSGRPDGGLVSAARFRGPRASESKPLTHQYVCVLIQVFNYILTMLILI